MGTLEIPAPHLVALNPICVKLGSMEKRKEKFNWYLNLIRLPTNEISPYVYGKVTS